MTLQSATRAKPTTSMNDLPVFLQVFLRAFALLAVGLWMQTLATSASGKKSTDQPAGTDKSEHPVRDPKSAVDQAPAKPHDQPTEK